MKKNIGNLSGVGSTGYLVFICVVSALGGFLFGYDTVVINGTVIQVAEQYMLSATMQGTFVASALFGCMIGAAVAGVLSDRYGRQKALATSALLMLISAIGCGAAWDAWSLIAFRWIGGLGVGFASMVCPLYISEMSPEKIRGRMVTLFQFAITIGIMVAFIVNAGWQKLAEAGAPVDSVGLYNLLVCEQVWRSMFMSEAIPAIVFFVFCLVIPETPRFLAKIGRDSDAISVLERISGRETAKLRIAEIREVMTAEEGKISELFKGGFRKALIVGVFLAVVSEMSGVTVVLYYGAEILSNTGMAGAQALGGFAIVGFVNMLFTVIAIWLMDKAGRRPLLFIGTLGCSLALGTIGYLFLTGRTSGVAIVLIICIFMAFFAFSIGPIKWVVMSEIFPTKIRGRAVAIATLAVWVTDWIYNQFYPVITKDWLFNHVSEQAGTGYIFCFFALVLVPQLFFVLFFMPETKGRTLEEIERSWLKK